MWMKHCAAVIASGIVFGAGGALAHDGGGFGGGFGDGHGWHGGVPWQVQGLVTALTATQASSSSAPAACPFAVGDTFSGTVTPTFLPSSSSSGPGGGTPALQYRISINTSSYVTVFDEVFPVAKWHSPPTSGTLSFGVDGTTLSATGTFTATYTILSKVAATAVNNVVYTSPVDGTTTCTETDQVTLIGASLL